MNSADLTSPAITAANAALEAAGYHRTTPRDQIRDEHWHLIVTQDAAIDKALDEEEAEEARKRECQLRRQHAAGLALKLLRQKLERCQPQHAASLQGQIAAILSAHPTLS